MTELKRPKGSHAYLKTRDARIEELFLHEGLEPREIAERMLEEGTLLAASLDSAMHAVREVVAKIRKRIDAARSGDADVAVATSEIDAIERRLARLRQEYVRLVMIADGEPTENCKRSGIAVSACGNDLCIATAHLPFTGPAVGVMMMSTPQGPMTTYKALWPAGVRQKASKDAALLAEKIADIEAVLLDRREAQRDAASGGESSAAGLTIVESDRPIPELIKANLVVGRFNKKGTDGKGGATASA